jgi:hypothetical protein
VLRVIRADVLHRVDAMAVDALQPGDRPIYVRETSLDRHPGAAGNGTWRPN